MASETPPSRSASATRERPVPSSRRPRRAWGWLVFVAWMAAATADSPAPAAPDICEPQPFFGLGHIFDNPGLGASPRDAFGRGVAFVGSRVLVGAPEIGAAYLLDGDPASPSFGQVLRVFREPAESAGNFFGFAVTAVGTGVLIGAPLADVDGAEDAGAAYLFDGDPTSPSFGQLRRRFTSPNPARGEQFGFAVAAAASGVLIGAPFTDVENQEDAGVAYLLDPASGATLRRLSKADPGAGDGFGAAVAAAGTAILIGAPFDGDREAAAGAAYLFDGPTPVRLEKQEPAAGDLFGAAVAVSDRLLVVGTPFDDTSATDAGAAYVFDRRTPTLSRPLAPPGAPVGHTFGASVAADGTRVLVGAPDLRPQGPGTGGAAYLFDDALGDQAPRAIPNPARSQGNQFGIAAELSQAAFLVGAPQAGQGRAYLFSARTCQIGCGNGILEDEEECEDGNTLDGDCCSSACKLEPAGTVCRSAAGSCDVAETCSGFDPFCPADTFKPATTVCRASAGECDPAERCTGSSATCPADALVPTGTLCR